MNKVIALFVASASAVKLDAIPATAIMQNNPSHWRKVWPEGAVDNADGDAEVLDRFTYPEVHHVEEPKEKYPWSFSDDVVETQSSIKKAEDITKQSFSDEGAHARGMNMISTYDNTKRVFERNLPYGPTWNDYNENTTQMNKLSGNPLVAK